MITRKTYIKAAKIVSELRKEARSTYHPKGGSQRLYEENVAVEVEDAFVKLFHGDNPRFNKEKFLDACGADK
jgi:hypothetical protein